MQQGQSQFLDIRERPRAELGEIPEPHSQGKHKTPTKRQEEMEKRDKVKGCKLNSLWVSLMVMASFKGLVLGLVGHAAKGLWLVPQVG